MTLLKCINCCQNVAESEVYHNKQHSNYLNHHFGSVEESVTDEQGGNCVCNQCVFYRVEKCSGCGKALPLCMYTLDQWFIPKSQARRCIDCTAMEDTKTLMALVKGAPASRYIMQCCECSDFKLLCSFLLLDKELGKGRRAIREGNDSGPGCCLKCQLSRDISDYKQAVYNRYRLEISSDPLPGQKSPTRSCTNCLDYPQISAMSYAKAVAGDSAMDYYKMRKPHGELKSNPAVQGRGPELVVASLQDSLCIAVNNVLCSGIPRLMRKVQLELELRGLPMSISKEVLRRKLRQTSHSFSVQATEETNFFDPETRWAYMSIYTPVHASIVCDTLMHSKVSPLVNLLHGCRTSKGRTQICCFGAGPGSEVLGLHNWFPQDTVYHLLDNCTLWQHDAKALLNEQLKVDFTYSYIDLCHKIQPETTKQVKASSLFTFVKFLSAVQHRSSAINYLRSVFDLASSGSLFLFVDNCNHEMRHFIESFVFPDGVFTRKTDCKESTKYRLFSTYSEFRFDVDDMTSASSNVFDWLSLLLEWVDRPPLAELRVFIFVVEKL